MNQKASDVGSTFRFKVNSPDEVAELNIDNDEIKLHTIGIEGDKYPIILQRRT